MSFPSEEPLFKVISGAPTDEELAAVVGVLLARTRNTAPVDPAPAASAWRRSGLPGAPRPWRGSGIRF